jgi:hypothetical protein
VRDGTRESDHGRFDKTVAHGELSLRARWKKPRNNIEIIRSSPTPNIADSR